MEMKSCKLKNDVPGSGVSESKLSVQDEPRYPEISFGNTNNYGSIPLDLEDIEAGDKIVVKLIARVKRITEEETQVIGEDEKETCHGSLDILEAGFEPYGEKEMRKKTPEKIESEIDETLNEKN